MKVAAFVDGELHVPDRDDQGREVVLALPLSRLLMKVVRVPVGEDPLVVATPLLRAISPYPDDPLRVTCETVGADEAGSIVIAAAFPESSGDDIAEALDAAKLNVVRIDSLMIGALRGLWSELHVEDGARRLLVLRETKTLSLVVLDGDRPVSIRSVSADANLQRETWLSLLEAEDFNGARPLFETIERDLNLESSLAGVRERASDPESLDALPDSWREVLEEERFKKKLVRNLIAAVVVWILGLVVLFGVPKVYAMRTSGVKDLCKAHAARYREVAEMREKTELVRKYSDHARGALEVMKAVSDRLPAGVTISDWRFSHDKGVTVRCESAVKDDAWELKTRLEKMNVFPAVELGQIRFDRNVYRFEIQCLNESEEEDS